MVSNLKITKNSILFDKIPKDSESKMSLGDLVSKKEQSGLDTFFQWDYCISNEL